MTAPAPKPRIEPLEPPFEPAVGESLQAMMGGSGIPPIALFRTLARHPQLSDAMRGLGRFVLGPDLKLGLRLRELVIDRVCARCGCEYEWGVHATAFGARAGLSASQLAATVSEAVPVPAWSEEDALVLAAVDELHDSARVSDALWARLAARFSTEQLLELLVLAGWYHAIAYAIHGAGVPLEAWAARFPES
ncbi:MAG TPA: carboxymuconolactone decarboxylase family protein [Myxococcota bacterium]|nr:carboxymuconolactone decarboxylase family protein [Myxococcota bacterium]